MISRLGIKGIEFVRANIIRGQGKISELVPMGNSVLKDTVDSSMKRLGRLKLYNSENGNRYLFDFKQNGEILISPRKSGSEDLNFLAHVKDKKYTKPKTSPEGTFPATEKGMRESNKLATEVISETEHFADGTRYCGPQAVFDNSGKNISRFKNGGQEIIIIDKTADKILSETISAFKNRIKSKKLTEEEKMNELMKFVDEVFSVDKSGKKIEELVSNIESSSQAEIFLGDIINSGAGVCRHRSLLTKILADEVGLKCRMIHGYYGSGGHAWNEIITKNDTYLFDAMHGNIFCVTKPSRNIVPQTFSYRITNPDNAEQKIAKYFDTESTAGIIYRCLKARAPVKTSDAVLTPIENGYSLMPLSGEIRVNGEKITAPKNLRAGDFVNIKDVGFQII